MSLIIVLAIALCAFGKFGVEARLKVYFEDVGIAALDPKYFDAEKTEVSIVENEDGDENSLSSTLMIIKKLPATADARLTLTGLSMGEYTLPSGLDLGMKLCEMLDEPIIMGPFFAVLGFSKDECPPEPGLYSQEGYQLPLEALPEEFPENKYLANVVISQKGKPLVSANIWANIQAE